MLDVIEKQLQELRYIKNFYRRKRIDNKIILTTDHGTWMVLSEEQYQEFQEDDIDDKLYEDLEERGLIITTSNYEKIVKTYYKRYGSIEKGAGLHIIVPTIRCNLRCTYCHSEAASITEGKQFDMDENTLEKTLEFIFNSPNPNITIEFQGGEPLLNKPIVKKTLEYARKLNKKHNKNYRIALVTNLIAMDEELLDFFVEHKDVLSLCTSLDGPKEVHDMNRKYVNSNVGTYDKVTSWIRRCKEKGLNMGLLMVTTKYSLPYWKEIIDEYVKWGQTSIQIKPLDFLGYAAEVWDDIGYTMEEFLDFWVKCVDYMFELLDEGIVIGERYLNIAFRNLFYGTDVNFLDWGNPCGMVRGQIVYNYNGDIYCCDEARVLDNFIIGNVYEDNYVDLIKSNKVQDLIKTSILEGYYCDSCAYKPFCGVCPVLHFAQNGDYRIKLNKTNRCQKNRTILDYAFRKTIFEGDRVRKLLVGSMLKNKFDYVNK